MWYYFQSALHYFWSPGIFIRFITTGIALLFPISFFSTIFCFPNTVNFPIMLVPYFNLHTMISLVIPSFTLFIYLFTVWIQPHSNFFKPFIIHYFYICMLYINTNYFVQITEYFFELLLCYRKIPVRNFSLYFPHSESRQLQKSGIKVIPLLIWFYTSNLRNKEK